MDDRIDRRTMPGGTRVRQARGLGALVAAACAVLVVLVLRLGLGTGALTPRWDEPLMHPVVMDIVTDGWSATTLLDYEDTKGPVFFVTYAAFAEIAGSEVARLRILSMAFFVAATAVFGLLAARAGLPLPRALMATGLFLLLPYFAVLGQLFMSEASFVFGVLALTLVFLMSLERAGQPRTTLIVVFGLLLAGLLHHRPHAVVYAGAMLLVVTAAKGQRAWPWWVAVIAAGAMRLPLYLRWGGLVTESYQARLGLGMRLDSLTYVAVALLPATWLLVWPALKQRRQPWVVAGGIIGLLLGAFAVPDLGLHIDGGKARYMGMVATTIRPLDPLTARIAFAVFGAAGGAALAALAALGWGQRSRERAGLLVRLAATVVLLGWIAYGMTRGAVFDRYLLAFTPLLPFVWMKYLSPRLLALQGLVLFALSVRLVGSWLS